MDFLDKFSRTTKVVVKSTLNPMGYDRNKPEDIPSSFQEKQGIKLGLMSFFVKAVVESLKAFPDLNSYIDKDEIVHREYYDIGIAVSAEKGLFVPVVKDADQLSFADIEKKIADYKKNAKQNKNPDDSFSADYFRGPEDRNLPPPSVEQRIGTTGHIVEWLALAMTDDELRAPWMQLAVNRLSLLILEMGNQPIDGGAVYHAAHGLHIYHERVFGTPNTGR